MSNKPRRPASSDKPASRSAASGSKAPGRSNTTTLLIIAGVVALVAILAVVVAIAVGSGDDDEAAVPTVPVVDGVADCADADPGEPLEPGMPDPFPAGDIFKPVAITGTPLAELTSAVQSGDEPDAGLCAQAPVLAGYDYAGEPITIDPATDGPTLVVFLAHWCPHCNREVPVLNEWRDSGDVPEGLNVVGVSTAAREGEANFPPDQWLTAMDWTWPVLADGDIAADEGTEVDGDVVYDTAFRAYGSTSFPTLAFVDGDGLLRWRLSGEVPIPVIQQLVDAAMADGSAG